MNYGNTYMYKNDNGYAVPPVSDCCRSAIVYFRPDAHQYVQWYGWWDVESSRFRCNKCNRQCKPAKPRSAI